MKYNALLVRWTLVSCAYHASRPQPAFLVANSNNQIDRSLRACPCEPTRPSSPPRRQRIHPSTHRSGCPQRAQTCRGSRARGRGSGAGSGRTRGYQGTGSVRSRLQGISIPRPTTKHSCCGNLHPSYRCWYCEGSLGTFWGCCCCCCWPPNICSKNPNWACVELIRERRTSGREAKKRILGNGFGMKYQTI